MVGKLAEDGKIAVRNVRRDGLKQLEKLQKDGALSEDELARAGFPFFSFSPPPSSPQLHLDSVAHDRPCGMVCNMFNNTI